MHTKFKVFILFFLAFYIGYGQASYPQNDFINPLRVPLSLSGNFGELRNNHFHSGLDIRTQQRIGLDVLAVAEGHISRIGVSPWGYGNVIYVQHPNGYTSVYGHLSEFAPKIREYLRKQQYKQEKNTINLYPEEEEIPINQGEVIAQSGNSGSSGGPHLHFEIRDGKQNALNPLLFGIQIHDTKPPKINTVHVYPEGNEAYANRSKKPQKIQITAQGNDTYITDPVQASGTIGFGVSAEDYSDSAPYRLGIYHIQTCLNGETLYDLTFNTFSFTNTRFINDFIDYAFYQDRQKRIQKLFLTPHNGMDVPLDQLHQGFVNVEEGMNYNYEIVLTDFEGNQTSITIPINGKELPEEEIQPKDDLPTDYYAFVEKPNVFDFRHHDIFIPKGALYKDTYLHLEEEGENQIRVHDEYTALHRDITIGFDASGYSAEDFEKLYVARINKRGREYYSPTQKDNKRITTQTKIFGTFKLMLDKTSPRIFPVNFKNGEWVSSLDFLKLRIKDEDSGIHAYRGTLNGHFIVLEYDYKTGVIQYDFRDGISEPGENKLEVTVVDNVGNSNTYTATFYRKA